MESNVLVVGIDPAPSKNSMIYCADRSICPDGWREVRAGQMPTAIRCLRRNAVKTNRTLLVCWDAPLTAGRPGCKRSYSTRPIESFFNSKKHRYKLPKGISVRGYSGCPHWTITRAALGLPRLGEYEPHESKLPLHLLSGNGGQEWPNNAGHFVVEVHPALAMWLWGRNETRDWGYKSSDKKITKRRLCGQQLWKAVKSHVPQDLHPAQCEWENDQFSDDKLDAYIAWAIGELWVRSDNVRLLGDADAGAFLLPHEQDLWSTFETFVATYR